MLDSIGVIRRYTINKTEIDLEQDRVIRDMVLMNLVVIGETAAKASDQLKWTYPKIPWKDIVGLRDLIVHHYHEVNISKAWKVIALLGSLEKQLLQILKDLDA